GRDSATRAGLRAGFRKHLRAAQRDGSDRRASPGHVHRTAERTTIPAWIRQRGSGFGAADVARTFGSVARLETGRGCISPLLRRITMTRQNLFSGLWDGDHDDYRTRRRVFWRPDDARMGATLLELAPGAPQSNMHMHFGAEEMFFVLGGRPL